MNPLPDVSFGEWLKRRRRGMGLTQQQLAAQINYSTIALKKIEAEERRPSQEIVERLAEILSIPVEERAAFLRFARGDWQAAPLSARQSTVWQDATSPRSNLPATVTSLIGREKAVTEVQDYLLSPGIRLVTLIGPPGIGKTRVGIESARRVLKDFPNGIFFIALASLEDPSLIASTIVQALGYASPGKQSASQQLEEGIADKQMLLVLDSCEHLIEKVALLASRLLLECPQLKILATSREALHIQGEWLYMVPPLASPGEGSFLELESVPQFPALTLFAERARAVRSDFLLDKNNIGPVASICAQLDGLPLAIELIAARVRFLSPASLLVQMNDQFVLSAGGRRAASTRQKTLQDAIGWSYQLLSEQERRLFASLFVFVGGFTLAAAQAVFLDNFTENSVSELVVSLLDKSLLQHAFPKEINGETRFHMLVTLRSFAAQRIAELGEETAVRARHASYFLRLAEEADEHIHGPDQRAWLDRLDTELENLRLALAWYVSVQNTESALRLLGALGWPWLIRGHYKDARTWFEQIRPLPGLESYPALYARSLNHAGRLGWLLQEFEEAQSFLEEAERIWSKLGVEGERGLARNLYLKAMLSRFHQNDNNETARSLYQKSFELLKKYDDHQGMAFPLFNLGWIADERHDEDLAFSLFKQSLDMYRQTGDLWGMSRVCLSLGQFFLKRKAYEKARPYLEQNLMLEESIHFNYGIGVALSNLGDLYLFQGDYDQAEEYYQRSLALSREYDLKPGIVSSLFCLGFLALSRNNYVNAWQFFREFYSSSRGSGEASTTGDFLSGAAAVAAGMSQPQRAACLSGAAQAILGSTDARRWAIFQAEFDRHIQIAKDHLGEAMFEELVAEGRSITLEEAVDYALESLSD